MCLAKTPKLPEQKPAPQAAKMPDAAPLKRRNGAQGSALAAPGGSTLLTGPSGIDQSALLIGNASLLGGGK